MKAISQIILIILFSVKLFAQETPLLMEGELINKEDLKKKAGWLKLRVDSNFKVIAKDAPSVYECYVFADCKGFWQFPFPEKNFTVTYKNAIPSGESKLLNGMVDFYDTKHRRMFKYIFKDGFYLRIQDYTRLGLRKKYTGQLVSIFEYIPKKNSFEANVNTYNIKGEYTGYYHGEYDGYTHTPLPFIKKIEPMSFE